MKKFSKIQIGIIIGIFFGIVDIIPMVLMKMTLDTLLAAFTMCIVGGFFISTSNLKINKILKGTLIFFLVALPMMIIVFASSPIELVPMLFSNLVLGSLMGYFIGRFEEKQS